MVSSANNPDPVFTLGDCHVLRVRVDVDESDVAQLRVGARAYVTARTFGDRKFWGRVVQIGEQLGKKNVETDEPTEHVDKKILETLVQLDGGPRTPRRTARRWLYRDATITRGSGFGVRG